MYKQQRFHTQHHVSRNMFLLPALCSVTSINESAAIPRWPEDHRSESFSDEPVSPTVGCTGQVKRNCRAVGLPNTTSATTAKYSKLKKLFSGRNLISAAAASLSPAILAASCRAGGGRGRAADACEWPRRRVCAAAPAESTESRSSCCRLLDVVREMDPPLPVVKKVRKAEDGECLWKRRFGGAAVDLKNLELQQIHHQHLRLCTKLDRR